MNSQKLLALFPQILYSKLLNMNQYEITYFSDPQLTEEARHELDSSIEAKITQLNGAIEKNTPNIRRRIMYPIKKKVNGFLRAINLQIDPANIAEVQQFLKREAGVLRSVVLQTKPRAEVPADIVERHAPNRQKKAGIKKPMMAKTTPKISKPAKAVTMEDVEKGIEEALSQEVK